MNSEFCSAPSSRHFFFFCARDAFEVQPGKLGKMKKVTKISPDQAKSSNINEIEITIDLSQQEDTRRGKEKLGMPKESPHTSARVGAFSFKIVFTLKIHD